MDQLPEAVVELLRTHEARQIGLIAQIDQLQATVRELEEWADMCETMRSQDV